MKKLAIALFACALAGCVAAPVVPPLGIVYTDIRAPLTPAGNVGSKRGTSTVVAICGLFSWGDGGIRKAAANGNIQDVNLPNAAGTAQEVVASATYEQVSRVHASTPATTYYLNRLKTRTTYATPTGGSARPPPRGSATAC